MAKMARDDAITRRLRYLAELDNRKKKRQPPVESFFLPPVLEILQVRSRGLHLRKAKQPSHLNSTRGEFGRIVLRHAQVYRERNERALTARAGRSPHFKSSSSP